MRFNFDVLQPYYFDTLSGSLDIAINNNGYRCTFIAGNGSEAIYDANNIRKNNVIHIEFDESVDWDLMPDFWQYNPSRYFVVDEDPTYRFFVITDFDGKWKLPISGNNIIAQNKNTKAIEAASTTQEREAYLLGSFDTIDVVSNMSSNGNDLSNTANVNLYLEYNSHEFTYFSIYGWTIGSNRKLTNVLVPDGIYTIDSCVPTNVALETSFIVINGIWHLLIGYDQPDNGPAVIALKAALTDGNGNVRKSRAEGHVEIWCDEIKYLGEYTTVEAVMQKTVDVIPESMLGDTIYASDDGAAFTYPNAVPDLVFSFNQ